MRLLLDTNVFLSFSQPAGLPIAWAEAIDAADQVFLSAASMWEIAIKHRNGKLALSGDPASVVAQGMESLQLMPLDISGRHVLATSSLPMHHKDPFDRLLVAQARCERLTIVTRDRAMRKYDVPSLPLGQRRQI